MSMTNGGFVVVVATAALFGMGPAQRDVGSGAQPAADAAPPPLLVVGAPVAYTPPSRPVSVICDDTSVVRVEDAGTYLRLVGLKPGETSCSFGSATRAGRRQLYHFTVRAAP